MEPVSTIDPNNEDCNNGLHHTNGGHSTASKGSFDITSTLESYSKKNFLTFYLYMFLIFQIWWGLFSLNFWLVGIISHYVAFIIWITQIMLIWRHLPVMNFMKWIQVCADVDEILVLSLFHLLIAMVLVSYDLFWIMHPTIPNWVRYPKERKNLLLIAYF